ncbi:MAG: hypothetical protein ACRDI2_15665 [Chloroflexota bacterium]
MADKASDEPNRSTGEVNLGIVPVIVYFAVMLALLIAFIAVCVYVISRPVPGPGFI